MTDSALCFCHAMVPFTQLMQSNNWCPQNNVIVKNGKRNWIKSILSCHENDEIEIPFRKWDEFLW